MAKISGSISNFANGVSQQAQALRLATQGQRQVNAYSTVVDGLVKRPPTQRVAQVSSGSILSDPTHSHFINRDSNEKYNVLFSKSGIKVFDLLGNEKTVTYPNGMSYLDYAGNGRPPYRSLSIGDYTFLTNTTIATALDAGNKAPTAKQEALVHVMAGNYGKTYTVSIDGVVRASFATPDGSSASQVTQVATTYIAQQLYNGLVASGYNTGNWQTKLFKGSLVVTNTAGTNFTIDTADGYNDHAMKAFKETAQDFADLPSHCEDGFVVQITGSPGNEYDNYYVKFVAQGSTSLGYWEEVPQPGIELSFDPATMPHVLIRQGNGDFTFEQAVWDERKAGNDETLPPPSFVGKAITEISFFKNRLGFLAGESVILGRSGSYFDWWRATATALLDDDPIDVASTAPGVTHFRSAAVFSDRLVLFADQNQLVLRGNELLTPKTASIRLTTSYATSGSCRPVPSGDVVFFAAERGDYSMIREYRFVEDDAKANEITGHVPQYIPKNVTKLAASTHEDILVALSEDDPTKLYVYKYYWANNQRLQASWSVWEFPSCDKILDVEFLDSKLYLIIQRPDGSYIETINVQPGSVDKGSNYVCNLDRRFVHLDLVGRTYDPIRDETTIPMTVDITTDDYVCVTSGELNTGSGILVNILSETPTSIVVEGDYSASALFFGIHYTMEYTLSTIFIRSSGADGKGSYTTAEGRLQLLHLLIQSSKSNYFRVIVDQVGRQSRTYVRTTNIVDDPNALTDAVTLTDDPFKVPILGKNTACTIHIVNDSYLPSSILSAEWTANYNQQSRRI